MATDIDDWSDMFPDTVGISEFASRDSYGKPLFGSQVSYRGRVVYKPTKVNDSSGQEVVAKGQVWIQGVPAIDPEDEIELPDGTTPRVLSVSKFPDQNGMHHVVVFFG